jgi:methionyl-tRNA formyltransferase
VRVLFMGSPEFSIPALDALHARHEIVGVYTQPDRPAHRGQQPTPPAIKRRALELGLPVFQPQRASAPEELARVRALNIDVAVVVAYGQLLKQEFLDIPPLGCVNIHASLLPRWRGAAPIQMSLWAGDAETGVTTMRMALKLDAGDMLIRKSTPIAPSDTAQTLHDRLSILGAELILPTLDGLEKKNLHGTPQDESCVTYAPKIAKTMEWLSPSRDASALDRQIRALTPWPGTAVRLSSGERLRVLEAIPSTETAPQGQIIARGGRVLLGCRGGALELHRFQWDGKKPVDAAAFLNGLNGRGSALPLQVEFPPEVRDELPWENPR